MSRRMLLASMWCGCGADATHVPINSVSMEWLFTNASVLLWADKLLVTEKDFSNMHRLSYFDDDVDKECARTLFDRLRDEGIIEVFRPELYLNSITLGSISEQVAADEARWGAPSPPDEKGLVNHAYVKIGEHSYCPPKIQGVYGSLTLARFLDCTCVFDPYERMFLQDRFRMLDEIPELSSAGQNVFSELYQVFLPSIIPENDFQLFCHPERGSNCAHAEECRVNAKKNLGRMIDYILVAREKPELRSLAHRLDQLESDVGSNEARIRQALLRDVSREQRNLRLAYPAIRNWARLTQKISVPVILYGTQTKSALVWMSAAAIAALAEVVHLSVDAIQERSRWLTLLADSAEKPKAVGVSSKRFRHVRSSLSRK